MRLAGVTGDNGLLARPPLPEASQKLGAASEDAVFGPGTNQRKQRHFLRLLGRRQLFSFSEHSLLMPVFPLGSQRLVEKTMPSSIFSLHKNPFNFLIIWQTAPSSLPSPFCSSPPSSVSGRVSITPNIWAGGEKFGGSHKCFQTYKGWTLCSGLMCAHCCCRCFIWIIEVDGDMAFSPLPILFQLLILSSG